MTQCGGKRRFSLESNVLEFADSGIITRPHDFHGTQSLVLGEGNGTHSAVAEFPQDPITLDDQRTLTELH